jgi:hypothetical protein
MSDQTPPTLRPGDYPPVMVMLARRAWLWTETAEALQRLALPPGSEVRHEHGPHTAAHKRRTLAEYFMRSSGFESLFFLDDDMTPPPWTVLRLLSHNLPIVGALYFQRWPPYRINAGPDWPLGGHLEMPQLAEPPVVRPVEWVGTGALLIRREVFERIPRPWFEYCDDGDGEDVYFSRKARAAGIPIHCDTGLCVGHLAVVGIDRDYVANWWMTQRRALAR